MIFHEIVPWIIEFSIQTKIFSCGGIKEFEYPCEYAYGVIVKKSLNELEYFNQSLCSGSLIPVDKEDKWNERYNRNQSWTNYEKIT